MKLWTENSFTIIVCILIIAFVLGVRSCVDKQCATTCSPLKYKTVGRDLICLCVQDDGTVVLKDELFEGGGQNQKLEP